MALRCREVGKHRGDAGLVPPRGSTGSWDALGVRCRTPVGTVRRSCTDTASRDPRPWECRHRSRPHPWEVLRSPTHPRLEGRAGNVPKRGRLPPRPRSPALGLRSASAWLPPTRAGAARVVSVKSLAKHDWGQKQPRGSRAVRRRLQPRHRGSAGAAFPGLPRATNPNFILFFSSSFLFFALSASQR